MPGRRAIATLVATLAIGAGAIVAGCGSGSTGPATTAADGRGVYDPDHRFITLPPGPAFIVRMPDPGEGQRWRLATPDGMGGVSLKGLEQASGAGDWYFETIGAGEGTLEFLKTATDSEDSSESVTYEVKIG